MQTPSAAWTTASQLTKTQGRLSGSYQPIVLLDLLAVNRTFSTRTYAPGGPLTVGPGVLVGSGITVGGQLPAAETLIAKLSDGGLGTLSLDLSETEDSLRIGGLAGALLNQEDLAASFEPTVLDNTPVRVRLGYKDLGPTEFLTLATLMLDRIPTSQERLILSMIDGSIRRNRSLSVPVGGQYFPGTPLASRNKHIPIVLGVNVDAPTIQVAGTAVGTLAFAMSTSSATLALVEYGALFPDSGTMTIEAETGVTYSSRQLVTIAGTTYLQLNGLVRGSPVTHAAGVTVTLTNVAYIYLIGYAISALNTVRNNGVVVAPAGYTLSTVTADRRVSLLTFTTQQGTVTVDVNAGNIDTTNLFTNGGFETGNLTGWTVGSGATAVVGTTSPTPYAGTYRAALTGGLGVYRDLSQEFSTVVGEEYRLEFSYQNADNNALANGGFENGDLTGWTTEILGGPLVTVQVVGDQVSFQIGTFTQVYMAAEGQYLAVASSRSSVPSLVRLFADVVTTIGANYTFQFSHISHLFTSYGQSGIGTTTVRQGVAGYAIGTTALPQSIVADTFVLPTHTLRQGGMFLGTPPLLGGSQINPGYSTVAVTFVATATTTRLTLLAKGSGSARQFGGGNWAGLPVVFDAVTLYASAVVDGSKAAYQVGSSTTPNQYLDVELPIRPRWARQQATFTPVTATTRLTLRSQYAVTSRNTFFDEVTMRRVFMIHAGSGGQNPAEAIAYIIDTFLETPRDTTTFTQAYTKLIDWQFGAVLTDPGDSKAVLQRMARQCKSLLYEDQDGAYRMVVLDDSRTVQRGFAPSNIIKGSWERLPESLDTVSTDIYVWFGAKTGGSMNPDDFQGVAYATPDTTTHPTALSLVPQCAQAATFYGQRHRVDIFADFVTDLYTAHLLLEWTVQRRTLRQDRITLRTWLDAAPLQMGDLVQVQHPSLPQGGLPVLAEVVGWHADLARMQIELTLRTIRPGWWSADFEYTSQVIDSVGWASDFEYAATGSQSAVGWEAQFEPDELLLPALARKRQGIPDDEEQAVGGPRRRPVGVIL